MTFPRPSRRTMLLLDVALLGWIAAWIVLGTAVAREVRGLRNLSTTVVLAGQSLEQTADLIGGLAGVPFVGDDVGNLAERVRQTGRSARRNARVSRESVEDLSVLLGVSIGLIPTIPLVALYLPLRLRWRSEARTIQRALLRDPPDPSLEHYLALRATQTIPYERLRAISDDPVADLLAGRTAALASAELERLGLRRARGDAPG